MPLYITVIGRDEPVEIPDTHTRAQVELDALTNGQPTTAPALQDLADGRDWIRLHRSHAVARHAIVDVFVANED